MDSVIGYYIHHHGSGHRIRSAEICRYIADDVTALTSMTLPDDSAYCDVVTLPRDDQGDVPGDPTAGGRMHWVPHHDQGLADRMHLIATWMQRSRPAAMVVDVSVEVATAARLFGIPVIVVAMPGERTDPPHELVYGLADHIIAAWPKDLYTPSWLVPHLDKTTFVGGISRFDGCTPQADRPQTRPQVLVLGGAGGSELTADVVAQWREDNPGFHWKALGVTGSPWVPDPWPDLCQATVVIAGAGQNSIADIAAAQRPAVIVPQARPFDEQRSTAAVLERNGLAVVRAQWPMHHEWSAILAQTRDLDPQRWALWHTQGAAGRAADTICAVADRAALSRVNA